MVRRPTRPGDRFVVPTCTATDWRIVHDVTRRMGRPTRTDKRPVVTRTHPYPDAETNPSKEQR